MSTLKDRLPAGSARNKIEFLAETFSQAMQEIATRFDNIGGQTAPNLIKNPRLTGGKGGLYEEKGGTHFHHKNHLSDTFAPFVHGETNLNKCGVTPGLRTFKSSKEYVDRSPNQYFIPEEHRNKTFLSIDMDKNYYTKNTAADFALFFDIAEIRKKSRAYFDLHAFYDFPADVSITIGFANITPVAPPNILTEREYTGIKKGVTRIQTLAVDPFGYTDKGALLFIRVKGSPPNGWLSLITEEFVLTEVDKDGVNIPPEPTYFNPKLIKSYEIVGNRFYPCLPNYIAAKFQHKYGTGQPRPIYDALRQLKLEDLYLTEVTENVFDTDYHIVSVEGDIVYFYVSDEMYEYVLRRAGTKGYVYGGFGAYVSAFPASSFYDHKLKRSDKEHHEASLFNRRPNVVRAA